MRSDPYFGCTVIGCMLDAVDCPVPLIRPVIRTLLGVDPMELVGERSRNSRAERGCPRFNRTQTGDLALLEAQLHSCPGDPDTLVYSSNKSSFYLQKSE